MSSRQNDLVDISKSLSSATPVLAHWEYEWNTIVAWLEAIYGLNSMGSH